MKCLEVLRMPIWIFLLILGAGGTLNSFAAEGSGQKLPDENRVPIRQEKTGRDNERMSDVSKTAFKESHKQYTKTPIDTLSVFWTFGNHEPVTMYKRVGRKTTGGAEGSSLWLEEWHHWFDSEESTKLMNDLGLTHLHCRFYKGLGWQFESKDFPRVKKFVENCHKHQVQALAYIQYASLYYEVMKAEYPDLESWAARDQDGKIQIYGSSYFRWLPCPNAPELEKLLKQTVKIALTEGNFDGIMYDNLAVIKPCYCSRCRDLFKEYLKKISNKEERFGIPMVEYMTPPPVIKFGEVQDPLQQEWIRFRCERMSALFQRLFDYAKDLKSDALLTGNPWDFNQPGTAVSFSIDQTRFAECFDFILSQNLNVPGTSAGYLKNRVHEFELGAALNIPLLALCDSDGGSASDNYYLPLVEDAVWGGIPADRTIIKPDREEMINKKELERRRPLLTRFQKMTKEYRTALAAPVFAPVKVLYSADSMMFSKISWDTLFAVEEILLKNHVPFGLLITKSDRTLTIPRDCEILIIPDQRCLSESELKEIIVFAQKGGKVISLGLNGLYDELYRQRKSNRFASDLNRCKGIAVHFETLDLPKSLTNRWKYAEYSSEKKRLISDLDDLWKVPFKIVAPEQVLIKVRKTDQKTFVHFVNYSGKPISGIKIACAGAKKITVSVPLENQRSKTYETKAGKPVVLPTFDVYAVAELE